jgi:hypothetical protein
MNKTNASPSFTVSFLNVFFSVLVVFDFTPNKRTLKRKQSEKHGKEITLV